MPGVEVLYDGWEGDVMKFGDNMMEPIVSLFKAERAEELPVPVKAILIKELALWISVLHRPEVAGDPVPYADIAGPLQAYIPVE